MNLGAILSTGAFMGLLALNLWVHLWAPSYPPLRRALQISMLAYLLFAAGDLATYLVESPASYSAAVMVLYTGTILVGVSWWIMCLRYAESVGMPFSWGRRRWVNVPAALGALLWIALLTNPWHGQFLTPIQGARNEYHWLWWVNTAFSYGLGAIGGGLYVYLLASATSATLRTRLLFMVSAASVVLLSNIAYTILPINLNFDPTAIAFSICGTFFLLGVYRVGYFSLSRMAVRTILDQQPNGLLVNDTTGMPVYWNDSAESLLGNDLSQLPDHTTNWLATRLSPLDSAQPLSSLQPGKEAALFTAYRQPGRTFSVRLYTIESWSGAAQGHSYLFEDVTTARQRQAEKDQLQERIAQAQKLDGLGVLAGGIAHDFNNLLMGIRGNTELALLDIAAGKDPSERLKTLDEASRQAAELTHHLLTYAGQASGEFKRLDLSQLLTQFQQLLQTTVRHHRCDIALNIEDKLFVQGDAVQLKQIVMNLIINATEAAPTKSIVHLSAGCAHLASSELANYQHGSKASPGTYIWFEVSNRGRTIEPAVINKMFDPFFSTKGEGRGLGLAAVLGIVRKHGGALKVQSLAGHESGTRIRVLLPTATANIKESATAPKTATNSNATTGKVQHGGKQSNYILLVDDDQMVREVARRFLESAGYHALEADSGAKALEIVAELQEKIALIVLDVVMPDMNGPETWQRMQAMEAMEAMQSDLPVLFISGHPRGHLDDLLEKTDNYDTTNYLEKPFKRESFLREIRRLVPASLVRRYPQHENQRSS